MSKEQEAQEQPQAPAPGSPEYDAAMAAKYRESKGDVAAAQAESAPAVEKPADKPTKPEWVPEKFWDAEKGAVKAEEMAKSYSELEKKSSQPKTEEKPKGEESEEAAKDAVEEAGLDWDTIKAKGIKDGKLEDADYKRLEEDAGIPRELVDEYIELIQYRAQKNTEEAHELVGGKESMDNLLGWAAKSLAAEEITDFNDKLRGKNWRGAVNQLRFLYAEAHKSNEPKLQSGGNAPTTAAGYASRAEMKRDMSNPQYQTDPAFRALVAKRLQVSRFEADQ